MKPTLAHPAVLSALGAALLFGASTPLAKLLVGELPPLLLAGLLYLGSAIGLTGVRLIRDRGWSSPRLGRAGWPWLGGAIFAGGLVAPALLMFGLTETAASTASLLLNFESVLTALLAWLVFRENAGGRVVFGMALIVAGGVLLSWPTAAGAARGWLGPLAVVGACLGWAIDNNLTRKVAAADALFLGAVKGWTAGAANTALYLLFQPAPAAWGTAPAAMLVGFLGYGVSLALFVLALRGLGAARTGAYFSTAPFIGAAIAVALFPQLFHEAAAPAFWLAAALMGAGVWLHLTESHAHEHTHEPTEHSHLHVHDEHHRHEHEFTWDGQEPHTHLHRHEPVTHTHPHFPDIHHRHRH